MVSHSEQKSATNCISNHHLKENKRVNTYHRPSASISSRGSPMPKHLNFEIVPLSQVPSRSPSPEPAALPVVLVVDDEPVIANTLVAILRKQNYAATAAYNAEDALAVAKIIPPNFLITDILMPK